MEYSPPVPDDFDFSRGRKFQAEVLDRFRSSVHHPSSCIDGSFYMLAVFRRFTFRLTEESVSLALHSVLGGTPAGFHVHAESERHFRFSVASKAVGLHIRSVERFTTKNFDLYCFLWRDGTPNWKKDEIVWNKEQEKEWTTVSYRKKSRQTKNRVSFARDMILPSPPVKSKPIAVHPAQIKPATFPVTRSVKIGDFHCPLPVNDLACDRRLLFPNNDSVHVSSVFNKLHTTFENFQIPPEHGQRAAAGHWPSEPALSREVNTDSGARKPQHWPSIRQEDVAASGRAHRSFADSTVPVSMHLPNASLHISRDEPLNSLSHLMHCEQRAAADRLNSRAKDNGRDFDRVKDLSQFRSNGTRLCFRCLSPNHLVKYCQGKIRCNFCFGYNHNDCFRKKWVSNTTWRAKQQSVQNKSVSAAGVQSPTKKAHSTVSGNASLTQVTSCRGSPTAQLPPQTQTQLTPLLCLVSNQGASSSQAMANFPMDPHPFIAPEMHLDMGTPARVSRAEISFSGEPVRAHEDFVIALDVDNEINPPDYGIFLQQIRQYITHELHLQVTYCRIHPFGIGLIQLGSIFQRDQLLGGNDHDIDGFRVRFIRHDRALNYRPYPYARFGWIMILGYPLDYMSLQHIDETIAAWGKMIHWHNNPRNKAFVLIKCLYNDTDSVPLSMVFRNGEHQEGSGGSWTAPAYVLNWEEFNQPPPNLDEVPIDGNPHPLPQVLPGEAEHMENLVNENMQNFQQADQAWDAAVIQAGLHGWQPWPQNANNDNGGIGENIPAAQQPIPAQEMQIDEDFNLPAESNSESSSETQLIIQRGRGPEAIFNLDRTRSRQLPFVEPNAIHYKPNWIRPFITGQLLELLSDALPEHNPSAWWNSTVAVRVNLNPDQLNINLTINHRSGAGSIRPMATERQASTCQIIDLSGTTLIWVPPGTASHDHEAGSSSAATSFAMEAEIQAQVAQLESMDPYGIRQRPLRIRSPPNNPPQLQPTHLAITPHLPQTVDNQRAPTYPTVSQRVRTTIKTYRRRKFGILKLVQARVIKKTYSRKTKKEQLVGIATNHPAEQGTSNINETPVTVHNLRRSTRLGNINEGHRNVVVPNPRETAVRSASPREGLQQVASLAGNSVSSNSTEFIGPVKFPTVAEIDDCSIAFPEIPIQVLQDVGVNNCGLSPEEITRELLMDAKDNNSEDGSSGANNSSNVDG
ncbi:hypothetical protein EJB05_47304, partial [Eragrostis curvula]